MKQQTVKRFSALYRVERLHGTLLVALVELVERESVSLPVVMVFLRTVQSAMFYGITAYDYGIGTDWHQPGTDDPANKAASVRAVA